MTLAQNKITASAGSKLHVDGLQQEIVIWSQYRVSDPQVEGCDQLDDIQRFIPYLNPRSARSLQLWTEMQGPFTYEYTYQAFPIFPSSAWYICTRMRSMLSSSLRLSSTSPLWNPLKVLSFLIRTQRHTRYTLLLRTPMLCVRGLGTYSASIYSRYNNTFRHVHISST